MPAEQQIASFPVGASPQEQGRYIDTLIAEGRLSPERVALAGGLFHSGALCSQVKPQRLVKSYRGRITVGLELLPDKAIVEFAMESALRVFPFWEAFRGNDQRVGDALRLCRRWLEGSIDRPSMLLAHKAAAESLLEVDKALNGEEADVATACAMAAASAASNAARSASTPTKQMAAMFGGMAAKAAADGAADYLSEIQWQVERVTFMLLDIAR